MTRTSTGFENVAADLRSRIVSGRLAPGSKLPTWDRMAEQYAVARPTLMRAMEQLKRDGFVYSRSTRGTFVSERPPHLHRFAVVFANHPGDTKGGAWNRFWDTLRQQAPLVEQVCDVRLPVFFDVADPSSPGHAQLAHQIDQHRLGGLVIVGRPDLLATGLVADCSLPRIAIYGSDQPLDMPRVDIDRRSFIDRALDTLRQQGASEIAIVSNNTERWEGSDEAIARRGLRTKACWKLAAMGPAVVPLVRLLFDPDSSRRPDGLILADDNIVEYALAGLMATDRRVPEDVRVVTHCNWPWPVPSPVPVTRLGYDVCDILRRCVDHLKAMGRGDEVEALQRVPAVFERESISVVTSVDDGATAMVTV